MKTREIRCVKNGEFYRRTRFPRPTLLMSAPAVCDCCWSFLRSLVIWVLYSNGYLKPLVWTGEHIEDIRIH